MLRATQSELKLPGVLAEMALFKGYTASKPINIEASEMTGR